MLSLGHLFEQGAHDNATGVSSIIGAAETLNRLIKVGNLPRPKRTIRVLGMGECYGTMYYLEHNKDRVKRQWPQCASTRRPGCKILQARNTPGFSIRTPPSRTWIALALRLAEDITRWVGRPWTSGAPQFHGQLSRRSLDRNSYRDAARRIRRAGAPQQLDTPATVDPKSMRDLMVMNAAYTYFIASAGPAEKRWMAELALTRGYNQISTATEKILDQVAIESGVDSLGRLLLSRARKS